MVSNTQLLFRGITAIAITVYLAGCSSPETQVDAGGSFSGTVSRVWEDGMTVDGDDGETRRFDTWAVCGDTTAQNISTGDQVTVFAVQDVPDFEAQRILDADGQPLCATTTGAQPDAGAEVQPDAGAEAQPDAEGSFSGTVSRVWEDGMTVDGDDGETRRFDTWAICGDTTAQNISTGDQVTVFAVQDVPDFEAQRILDADGQPLCATTTPE